MATRERRNSYESPSPNNYEDIYNCIGSNSRKVHFDDENIIYANERKENNRIQLDYPDQTVHKITTKLKLSYERIEHSIEVLRTLFNDLLKTKKKLERCTYSEAFHHTENITELERLLTEVKQLQGCFQNTGNRKRKYLEELSKLQSTLHEDRKKMENWARMSSDSKKKLRTKINQTSRVTREQQLLINKLKADNMTLWNMLQEIQGHLREEHVDTGDSLQPLDTPGPYDVAAPKLLPNRPKRDNDDVINFTCGCLYNG